MATPEGARRHFSKGLLLSASILALWVPQGSRAALRIQKIPEHPQKNQDLLLSVRGIPDTFQDFNWYLGEEAHGGTMLFTYIPELQRPQRDGSAMGQRDIVGFPNGSMLLHRAQPTDSGTYQVAVTINPAWTMRAKTKVQVEVAAGALFIGSIAHLLLTRSWRGQSHRMPAPGGQGSLSVLFPAVSPVASTGPSPRSVTGPWATCQPVPPLSSASGDENIYEVMPSPTLPVSPLGDPGSANTAMPLPLPENHRYQDLLNPDPDPYCQLVPRP
ncbi:carcinoembryonic antigen-related cell adhesion molecule 19 [Puma concolor]|uniref:Carcinoembryonic antigen-related cell adhesion molecule 19 n=1 Tax=Puma concolor TaxID=9696 RepID=A0A6P6H4U3_PUMCO|nr:carcinoembryonic antigen-related cell adhesion molecule 19 [Puma concolor]